MDNFVNLRVHTTYSFKDGYGYPDEFANKAKELNQPAVAITDSHNISGHYKLYKTCKKNEIKPILGVSVFLSDDMHHIRDSGYDDVVLIPLSSEGYHNLTKILTDAWMSEKSDYKVERPVTSYDKLLEHKQDIIVLAGPSSIIGRQIRTGKDLSSEIEKLMKTDLYIEIQPPQDSQQLHIQRELIEFSKEHNIPVVATNDTHYPNKGQSDIHDILLCIDQGVSINDPERRRIHRNDLHMKTREEMANSMWELPLDVVITALDNTVNIANKVNFEFPMASAIRFNTSKDKIKLFKSKCYAGLKERELSESEEHVKRLEYEMDIIIQKDFVDYFLVVEDIVSWAKKHDILVGPARGSAAGSLASYCLAITEVEPIKHGLIFERFIDINREDMPDIDIDFQDDRRIEIKQYIENKYGKDKVGNLPVFLTWHGKMALDDIQKVFDIPHDVIDKLKPLIIERSGGDSRASFTIMDTLTNPNFEFPQQAMKRYPQLKYASNLEGYIRQMGRHAAGVVVSNEPVTNFGCIYNISGQQSVSLEYKDASSIGLLKLDLLGLSNLTVIQKTLKMIKERKGKDIDIYKLTLDDPKVYANFRKGKLFGIFQFTGQAVNQVCRQIKPNDFESLSAISALARPGPLNSGSTTIYIKRRNGLEEVSYPHEVMKEYTEETYGIVVYQEQVMRTMREVGKMSWKATAEIRKLISRSQGVEKFNTFKEQFAIGAKDNGMSDHEIDVMWDSICTFGSWAFNKSHSVSYTIISYWTMWLKVHYPIEYYSALLSTVASEDAKKKILKEYKRDGYKLLPVDINKSKESFTIEGKAIRLGLLDVRGVGPIYVEKIIKNQPYKSVEELMSSKMKLGAALQNLCDVGALDNIENPRPPTLFGPGDPMVVKRELDFKDRYKLCPWDMDFSITEKWIPFLKEDEKLKDLEISPIEVLNDDDSAKKPFTIMGVISEINLKNKVEEAQSKGIEFVPQEGELYDFCNLTFEDATDFITVRVSPEAFQFYKDIIFSDRKDDDVLLIKGVMGGGIRMFFANKIISLRPYSEMSLEQRSALLKQINAHSQQIKELRMKKYEKRSQTN